MKKIFIILVCMILLSLTMVSSVFADFGYVFDGKYSLLTASGLINCPFYFESGEAPTNYMAYKVSLKPNTDYTFISTKGSRRFYFGDYVSNSLSWGSAGTYLYSSNNLLPEDSLVSSSFVKNNDGTYTFTLVDSEQRFTQLLNLDLPLSDYTFKIDIISGNLPIYGYYYGSNGLTYFSFDSLGEVHIHDFITSLRLYIDYSDSLIQSSSVILNLMLNSGSESLPYEPYWNDSIYSDNFTTVYNFKTPFYGSTYLPNSNLYDFIIGINDVTSGNENELFSRYQSEQNIFYLVEGSYSIEDLSLILDGNRYQNGYNDGFNQGYKEGEYDGMNSTSIFKSVILTVLSGPFVVVSNALNFEIFGINIYTFIQIILTILIVAFLITRLKGRE